MARKKKVQEKGWNEPERTPPAIQNVVPEVVREIHEFGLSDLLVLWGRDRIFVKQFLQNSGVHEDYQAYAFLRGLDRIPGNLTHDQFDKIYQELMA